MSTAKNFIVLKFENQYERGAVNLLCLWVGMRFYQFDEDYFFGLSDIFYIIFTTLYLVDFPTLIWVASTPFLGQPFARLSRC